MSKAVVNANTLKALVGQRIDGEYEPDLVNRYDTFASILATQRRPRRRSASIDE